MFTWCPRKCGMSYINKFHDYVRDVPMEIGQRFFPPPTISLPTLTIPPLLNHPQYSFDAEKRARQQFDNRNKNQSTNKQSKLIFSTNGTSSISTNLNDVLQPSRPSPSTPPILSGSSHIQLRKCPVSFEEFESRGSVFDELEWKTIDDKAALSQILSSEVSGSVPVSQYHPISVTSMSSSYDPISYSALRSYPSLDFEGIEIKPRELPSTLGSTDDLDIMAIKQPIEANTCLLPLPTTPSSFDNDPLRFRLLTKGYRENLINIVLTQLPKERMAYVEYYIKAMSMLEKQGVSSESSLSFLIESNIKNKLVVIDRAQTAAQLIGMGFVPSQVFAALVSTQGERVKALDILLGISAYQ